MSITMHITGLGLWTPGFDSVSAWRQQTPDPALTAADKSLLNRQTARRASPFARAMIHAANQALVQSQHAGPDILTVFGSGLGETDVMVRLLDQLGQPEADFSPMLFAVSVHNAASGLMSISTQNHHFTTSIAADENTPAAGLFEAYGLLCQHQKPVLLVCGDEKSPPGLIPEDQCFDTLSVALMLELNVEGTPVRAQRSLGEISLPELVEADLRPREVSPRLASHPQIGLLDLVDAIAQGKQGRLRLDRGRGRGWSVNLRTAL